MPVEGRETVCVRPAWNRGRFRVREGIERVRREKKTVEVMLSIYCGDHHPTRNGLCGDCRELLKYSHEHLESCPYAEHKPTCARCPTHCYDEPHRERMRAVMRFSGPRMMTRHPVLAFLHMCDSLKRRDETA